MFNEIRIESGVSYKNEKSNLIKKSAKTYLYKGKEE